MSVRGLNVFVNIGAKLLPSLNSVATATERRFGVMQRRMRLMAAETRATMREVNRASAGLVGMAAAGGLTFGVTKAIGEGAELQHQLQMLRNAGRTSGEVARAMAQANRTIAALPTTTLTDNIQVLNETTGAFGNFAHALENLTFNQRIGSMLHNQIGDKAGTPGEMFNNIVRAMEMRGSAQNAAKYQREVGELYRAMTFTGGKVNPEEFLGYMQQANPYMKGFSDRYLYKIAPSLMQEYGGDRAGTMQNTWTGTLLGKAKNKIQTEAWIKMGLLDPSKVVYNKVGPVGWQPGAVKGTDLALRDPLAWTEKYLIPALRKNGFDTSNQLSLAKALMPMFRDRNANRLANTLVYDMDRQRLHKDEGLINQVPTADKAYRETLRRDPKMAWGTMVSSLSNLSAAIFGTQKGESPIAVAMVNIANGINSLAMMLEAHPILAKGIGVVLLGAAGLASLRLIGIGLGFVMSPLRGLMSLLFKAGPRQIGLVGWMLRGLSRLGAIGGRLLGGLGARLGPMALRGLMMVGPWLLRGLAAAFGLLSNPVGWAILAVSVGVLIYKYRGEIAKAWNSVTAWFTNTAWPAIVDTVSSIPWAKIGMAIADSLTFGLASKLPAIGAAIRSILPTWAGGTPAPLPAPVSPPPVGAPAVPPMLAAPKAVGAPAPMLVQSSPPAPPLATRVARPSTPMPLSVPPARAVPRRPSATSSPARRPPPASARSTATPASLLTRPAAPKPITMQVPAILVGPKPVARPSAPVRPAARPVVRTATPVPARSKPIATATRPATVKPGATPRQVKVITPAAPAPAKARAAQPAPAATFHIYGQSDPQATAREVDKRMKAHARKQATALSD